MILRIILKLSGGMRTPYATRPRELITEILREERRYLSAGDVFRFLSKAHAKVSLSTVYRTLDLLVARGTASSRVDAHGESTYVFCNSEHHHHAVCRDCGLVEEVDCGAIERFTSALRRHHGFILDDHSLEFYGRCAQCR